LDRTRDDLNTLRATVEVAVDVLVREWVSTAQADRVAAILRGFGGFCERGHGIADLACVTPSIAAAFVGAQCPDGTQPSVPLLHLRRSALRLLFRSARHLGQEVGDPTLDLRLPPRAQLATRPLVDEEVTLCRAAAAWSLSDRRRAAAWALAEASCRSVEVGQITRSDLDLDLGRVWIHGGQTTADRWGYLTEWGTQQLERRLASIPSGGDQPVVYEGDDGPATGQISACIAVRDVLVRAGLGKEPGVRPASVAGWAGRQILQETGRIDEVARRLGMSSLDRTARFIDWSWGDAD
jgi:integrase/recombinase XerC